MTGAAGFGFPDQIHADIFRRHRLDPGIGDTNQNDRFRMFDEIDAGYLCVAINRHHDMDRLAGISRCRDKVRRQEHIPQNNVPPERRDNRNIATQITQPVSSRNQRPDCNLVDKFCDDRLTVTDLSRRQEESQSRQQCRQNSVSRVHLHNRPVLNSLTGQ